MIQELFGYTNGLVFEDRDDLVRRASVGISHSTFSEGAGGVGDILTFRGDIELVGIQDSGITTSGPSENCLSLEESLSLGDTRIVWLYKWLSL